MGRSRLRNAPRTHTHGWVELESVQAVAATHGLDAGHHAFVYLGIVVIITRV